LPPLQRASLGVISAGSGALAIGLAGSAVKLFRKNNEIGGMRDGVEVSIPKTILAEIDKGNIDKTELLNKLAEGVEKFNDSTTSSSGSGSSSTSTRNIPGTSENSMTGSSTENIIDSGIDISGDGTFIASFLDNSENLSPLEILINYELLINTMILFHIIFIGIILLQIYNLKIISNGGVSLISKITNKYNLNKLQFVIDKLGNISKNYLLLLLIINVLILLFYIFLNIYILIEISNNLNEYIYVYNKINKCGILLLLNSCKYKNIYKNIIKNKIEKRMFRNISNFTYKSYRFATKITKIKNNRTFTTNYIIKNKSLLTASPYSLKDSNLCLNKDYSNYDLNKNTIVKEFYEKMNPFLKDIINILQTKDISNIEKQQ
jgi:hypothetical protein